MRADICERAAVYAQRDGQRGRALLWGGRRRASCVRSRGSARLAVCLRNQSIQWMDAGESVAALEAMDECIGLCRKSGAEEPDAGVEGILAACLDHRGTLLSTVGESTRAIASTEESVSLYRALARARPERYQRELAAGHRRSIGDARRPCAPQWRARRRGRSPRGHQQSPRRRGSRPGRQQRLRGECPAGWPGCPPVGQVKGGAAVAREGRAPRRNRRARLLQGAGAASTSPSAA